MHNDANFLPSFPFLEAPYQCNIKPKMTAIYTSTETTKCK